MNTVKLWISGFIILIATSASWAQSAKMKRAKEMMKDLNYTGAITLFSQILEREDNPEAKINIADCFRKVNDWENAEYWYGQVVKLPSAKPVHRLYYGMSLQRNGKCDLAKEWYERYVKEAPEDLRGQYLVKACDYEDELMTKNAGIYEIKHLDLNSNLDDFSPAIYKNSVIFASDRDKGAAVKRQHTWTGNPFNELYIVEFKQQKGEGCGNYQFGRTEKFSSTLNSKYHEAAVTFNNDQSVIYFTRNNYFNGKTGKSDENIVKLKIFSAKRAGNGWGAIESLPFNSDEYSVAHPTLSPDGNKLYFSSDMPGGFGGMDLYVSDLENGRWGPPMNLGPMINTEGNEIFPYFQKGGRLYFASDGHIGLGGLDLYYIDDRGNGQWSEPVNLGYPVNSISDDFGITMNDEGTCGFFTSDRAGGAGRDDIYSFKKTAVPVELFVYDKNTREPISNATIANNCTGTNTLKTGKDGKARLDMKINECCTFTASKEGYKKSDKEGCTKNLKESRLIVEIPIEREADVYMEGVVFDQASGLPLDGAKVSLANDCGLASDTFVTDATGRYRFKLARNCCFKVKGEKVNYLAVSSDNKCTRNLGDTTILQINLNLQPIFATPALTDAKSKTEPGITEPGKPEPGKTDLTSKDAGKTNTAQPEPGKSDMAKTEGAKSGKSGKTEPAPADKTGKQPGAGSELQPGKEDKNVASTEPTAKKGKAGKGKSKSETAAPKVVTYDNATGEYIDKSTGKPASGVINGITYKDGLIVKSDNNIFNPSPTPVGQNGEISYLLHIYYDFDQSYIREEAKSELEKLRKMLSDNPDIIIELGSHTDSRGSNSYNNRLSQRRAESVVRWLVERGVDRDRLVPRGYGETINVNQCSNNVPCSEKEHQLNRRTEFRVLGCRSLNCFNGVPTLSKPNTNPKVDPCHGCPF